MARVKKSVLVPFSAAAMFELVDQVELYPEFLPWCERVRVLESHAGGKTARIDVDFHRVKLHFTTDNANQPPESIVITLKSGPFRRLHGEWRFVAIGASACRVEFELTWEFPTDLIERAGGPVFGHIANTFIDAFVNRAESVYAKRP